MRVLITGAAGFVGRHLTDHCAAEGASVVGLGRSPAIAVDPPKALESYIGADLAEADQAVQAVRSAEPQLVFHLAAEASVARSWDDPLGAITKNLISSTNLLEAVRAQAPTARVLVACTGEEYGRPETLPLDESQPLRPRSPYAVGKTAVDQTAGFYADAFGMHVVRMRAFNHSGPGQSPTYVVSGLARQIARAEREHEHEHGHATAEIATGNTSVRRDFTDVRDVVRAYWLALEKCEPGAYNVCSGAAVSVQRIVDGLTTLAKVDVRARTDTSLLRPNEIEESYGSNERLRAATGWEPKIALLQTLGDTLAWWRENPDREVTSDR